MRTAAIISMVSSSQEEPSTSDTLYTLTFCVDRLARRMTAQRGTLNPVLEPLIDECPDFADILVVQINPIHRDDVPRTAQDIANRVNEVSFNAGLMREIRAIAGVTRLIEAGIVKDPRYKCVYFHRIAAEEAFKGMDVRSKFDTSPSFLKRLRDLGREHAERWLEKHFNDLGRASTLDLSDQGLGVRSRTAPS